MRKDHFSPSPANGRDLDPELNCGDAKGESTAWPGMDASRIAWRPIGSPHSTPMSQGIGWKGCGWSSNTCPVLCDAQISEARGQMMARRRWGGPLSRKVLGANPCDQPSRSVAVHNTPIRHHKCRGECSRYWRFNRRRLKADLEQAAAYLENSGRVRRILRPLSPLLKRGTLVFRST